MWQYLSLGCQVLISCSLWWRPIEQGSIPGQLFGEQPLLQLLGRGLASYQKTRVGRWTQLLLLVLLQHVFLIGRGRLSRRHQPRVIKMWQQMSGRELRTSDRGLKGPFRRGSLRYNILLMMVRLRGDECSWMAISLRKESAAIIAAVGGRLERRWDAVSAR